jgi:hypothetical protein
MASQMLIKTDCSECREKVTVDRIKGTVSAKVPASGRGAKRVFAHTVTQDLERDDGDLVTWDCPWPGCGYADSFDLNS